MLKTVKTASFNPVISHFLTPVYNWVKNVYSLCVERRVTGARSYTGIGTSPTLPIKSSVQAASFTHSIPTFTPGMYTAFLTNFNQLITYFYTLSTPPIITKKN